MNENTRGRPRIPAVSGLGRVQVPYWLGQTFVLGRRLPRLLWLFWVDA